MTFYHKFRNKRYKIRIRELGADGECTPPREKNRQISLHPKAENKLTTVIHEGLHACLWDLSEEAVEEISNNLATFIKKCLEKGYLKEKDLKDENHNR